MAPALTNRPVLAREVVRYGDPRASQLQTVIDDLIQQGRLVPGQLKPLIQLMGVGQVLVATDQAAGSRRPTPPRSPSRSAGTPATPTSTYGRTRFYGPPAGRGGIGARLPDVKRYAFPGRSSPGIVRVHPDQGATLIDGDASGIAELAAAGKLNPNRTLFYVGDTSSTLVAAEVHRGASLVFTDSNRRRVIEGNRLQDNLGPTLGANDPIPRDWPSYNLFPQRGRATRPVATYSGLSYLRAPPERGFSLLPEHRPTPRSTAT